MMLWGDSDRRTWRDWLLSPRDLILFCALIAFAWFLLWWQ
jgi:hypothetical protein